MRLAQNDPVPWDMTVEEMNAEVDRHLREKTKYIGKEWVVPTDRTKWFGVKHRLITHDLIRDYCDNVGDLNPLFWSEDYAANTRWGGVIAPPMIMHYVAMTAAGIALEPPDVPERGGRLRIHGAGGLNLGGLVNFYEPIRPGDTFRVVDKLILVDEVTKKNKPVPRLIRTIGQRKFINQHGKVVCAASGVELAMIPEKPLKRGEKIAMGDRFPPPFDHYYTEEEIDTINKMMYAEEIRGAEPRYWEDVNEGDEMVPVVKGPITVTDIACGMPFRGFLPGFEVRRMVDWSDDTYSNIDPRTGDMFGEYRCHVEDACAQMYGEPSAFVNGTQEQEWVCHITTNWMGDDGFMTKIACQPRKLIPVHETVTVKGKVAKKYKVGNEYVVDLDIVGTNWSGETVLTGGTTVRLPSKDPASWGEYMFASR